MELGANIQKYRLKNRLSQEQLAEKLSVSRQSVSKWELGQSYPEVDKIIQMSLLFSVSTDDLLMDSKAREIRAKNNKLHLGSIYLIVKDFQKSIAFYEQLLSMTVSTKNSTIFAEFFFDHQCISLMNEANLPGHDYRGNGDYKFVLNFWVNYLSIEHERLKDLAIGEITEIKQASPTYYYFHLHDPDGNVIEVTGG
ncbi:helix-turn-helix domain-containing protein [Paenibacillus mesotrionivorans]|uniref:Helix-turn-helix domain-containing protein n=1 Tax=Paenibacillus mesotrionivorans TaxID=3160968 RepID=A0ACC7P647_9BACL